MLKRGLFPRPGFGSQTRNALLGALALPMLVACSGGSDKYIDTSPPRSEPFAELYEQGIIRYLGLYTPMLSEQDGDTVNHFFAAVLTTQI